MKEKEVKEEVHCVFYRSLVFLDLRFGPKMDVGCGPTL